MSQDEYRLLIAAPDQSTSTQEARRLADTLRETDGVLAADRRKTERETMDLGSVVAVIATSGAAVAMAEGVADWLRRRRGTHLTIERHSGSHSIKMEVEGIDPEVAVRITELVHEA